MTRFGPHGVHSRSGGKVRSAWMFEVRNLHNIADTTGSWIQRVCELHVQLRKPRRGALPVAGRSAIAAAPSSGPAARLLDGSESGCQGERDHGCREGARSSDDVAVQ